MKYRKFELMVAIPDDRKTDRVKLEDLVEILRQYTSDYGADDCAIEVKEIRNNGKERNEN